MSKKLVVIGGGAAGFFCAVNVARMDPSLQVTIIEKTAKILSKVRVSGGGRCNVTNALEDITEMSKRYPRGQNFLKKTLHRFDNKSTVQWFRERAVPLKAEADGRMFPLTDDSQTIIDCLLQEADKFGVEIRMQTEVLSVERSGDGFTLLLKEKQPLYADHICIASGGYPKSSMFAWLKELGHSIEEPVPSLFTFNLPKHPITTLMGVSVPNARVKVEGTKLVEDGPVLITHWGLSGPGVLRTSAWGARLLAEKNYEFKVHINWSPGHTDASLKTELAASRAAHATKKISNHNFLQLPQRLYNFLLGQSGIDEDMRFADLPSKAENALIRNIVDSVFEVKGKTTFKEEFVTSGGIRLGEVDPNTMMSRKIPGVYFAGEVLDVDGITGGFNFQHAWTSGWIAADAIAKS